MQCFLNYKTLINVHIMKIRLEYCCIKYAVSTACKFVTYACLAIFIYADQSP